MKLNDRLKNIETVDHMGEVCWTYNGLIEATGMSRNTICNWIRDTRLGKLNLPFRCRKKGCKCFFPVDEFLRWYGYEEQN